MTETPTAAGTLRRIERVVETNEVMEGAGVPIRRALPSRAATYGAVDPFLLLDHFKVDSQAMGEGFPPHPHRGFEIVTYYIQGGGSHSDSEGNSAVIQQGGLQRITAGRGMWHGEGPGGDSGPDGAAGGAGGAGGTMEGLQLWVNLPRQQKGIAPGYQGVEAAQLPVTQVGDAQVKTLVGSGAPTELQVPAVYYDVTVPAGGTAELPLPEGYQGFAYLLQGSARLGQNREPAAAGQLAVLGAGGALPVAAGEGGVRFVLGAGTPIGEQPRWNGPYVD